MPSQTEQRWDSGEMGGESEAEFGGFRRTLEGVIKRVKPWNGACKKRHCLTHWVVNLPGRFPEWWELSESHREAAGGGGWGGRCQWPDAKSPPSIFSFEGIEWHPYWPTIRPFMAPWQQSDRSSQDAGLGSLVILETKHWETLKRYNGNQQKHLMPQKPILCVPLHQVDYQLVSFASRSRCLQSTYSSKQYKLQRDWIIQSKTAKD